MSDPIDARESVPAPGPDRPSRYMMRRNRKIGVLLALPALLGLTGCQIFGVAAGILNYLIPVAASVGGALLVYYLTKDD